MPHNTVAFSIEVISIHPDIAVPVEVDQNIPSQVAPATIANDQAGTIQQIPGTTHLPISLNHQSSTTATAHTAQATILIHTQVGIHITTITQQVIATLHTTTPIVVTQDYYTTDTLLTAHPVTYVAFLKAQTTN
jgi:hypothetical protein